MNRTLSAAAFLLKGPLILGLLVIINAMTSPGHWWVKWAALGIGIAWIVNFLRVVRSLVLVGGLAALVAFLWNKPPVNVLKRRFGWRDGLG